MHYHTFYILLTICKHCNNASSVLAYCISDGEVAKTIDLFVSCDSFCSLCIECHLRSNFFPKPLEIESPSCLVQQPLFCNRTVEDTRHWRLFMGKNKKK